MTKLIWDGWKARVNGGLLEVHNFGDERRYEVWFKGEPIVSGLRSAYGAKDYAGKWAGDKEVMDCPRCRHSRLISVRDGYGGRETLHVTLSCGHTVQTHPKEEDDNPHND
jgi:hypothetical protein